MKLLNAVVLSALLCSSLRAAIVISHRTDATQLERLAGAEVRRYLYLRTGELAEVRAGATDATITIALDPALAEQQFALRGKGKALKLTAREPLGTLWAAYRLAELLGIRFTLSGDVIPDERIPFSPPRVDETHSPAFAKRGLQPFHDFPEGPDWWTLDDYKAILSQLAKLRMNFFGLHTYPEGMPNAEPTTWIGLASDIGEKGTVRFAYPSWWFNTAIDGWGYHARRTSDFSFGASQLFDRDDFGSPVMHRDVPRPWSREACAGVFASSGAMLNDAFRFGRSVGIQSCVGTETPLVIPADLRKRLEAMGKSPDDPKAVADLYEGIFRRVSEAYPVDYYWLWTPERAIQVSQTQADLKAMLAGYAKARPAFKLALCGWGWLANNFETFDADLPKDVAFSCINDEVGNAAVSPKFASVSGRGKWAIPWLEDDPGLTMPQLWVGRMRADAIDAKRYGCDGLMGIHWRTRAISPNLEAIAQAGWRVDEWRKKHEEKDKPAFEAIGGSVVSFPANAIAGTEDAPLYQSVRYNLSGYRVSVPNGVYTVRLQFCEPHYPEKGKRVFAARLQGKTVIERLDIFETVGKDKALDYTFKDVQVTDGTLAITFDPIVEYPAIAAFDIDGPARVKVNCGGESYKDYLADRALPRYRVSDDFYRAWARDQFGLEEVGAVFARVDCALPRPATWINGPGMIAPDGRPWEQAKKDYAFVEELEALGGRVKGAGAKARFSYWVETFRYLRAMGRTACALHVRNAAAAAKDAAKLESAQRELAEAIEEAHQHLLATVSTSGELGTVANWQMRIIPDLLGAKVEALRTAYRGPTRLFVPTVRSVLEKGEPLRLRVIVQSEKPGESVTLHHRPMGGAEFMAAEMHHAARGVWECALDIAGTDIQYYIESKVGDQAARWPETAPAIAQTVIIMP